MSQPHQEEDENDDKSKVTRKMMMDAFKAADIDGPYGSHEQMWDLYKMLTESKESAQTEVSNKQSHPKPGSPDESNDPLEQRALVKKQEPKLKPQNQTPSGKNLNLLTAEHKKSFNEEPNRNANYKESYASKVGKGSSPSQNKFNLPGGRKNKQETNSKSHNFFANQLNENDVPLKSVRPVARERLEPFDCTDMIKMRAQISLNLQNTADLWRSMNRLAVDDPTEIQWETPIKVCNVAGLGHRNFYNKRR